MKYLYLFLVALGFAAFCVAWFKSIKNQVEKHLPHKMKQKQKHHPHHFTPHTPSGGVSRVHIGG